MAMALYRYPDTIVNAALSLIANELPKGRNFLAAVIALDAYVWSLGTIDDLRLYSEHWQFDKRNTVEPLWSIGPGSPKQRHLIRVSRFHVGAPEVSADPPSTARS